MSEARRGRPPIEDEPRSAVLQTRVTPGSAERYRVAADLDGRALSEVMRDLLDNWSERVLRS